MVLRFRFASRYPFIAPEVINQLILSSSDVEVGLFQIEELVSVYLFRSSFYNHRLLVSCIVITAKVLNY
jgi:hypothetical protein